MLKKFKRKPFILVLAGISLCSIAAYCASSSDTFSKAALHFREKSYNKSYSLALKSASTPERSFLMAVSAYRSGKLEESLPLLEQAEKQLPLLGDYAALYQAEALLKLGRHAEASYRADGVIKNYPGSLLIRKAEKVKVDAFVAAGDHNGAIKSGRAFIEKYASGADTVEVLYHAALSREQTGDREGAAVIYRSIWLNNPLSAQSGKSIERLKALEAKGTRVEAFSAAELIRRSTTLYALNEFSQSLKVVQAIPQAGQPASVLDQIHLRSGLAYYRLKNWKAADRSLVRAVASKSPAISSEARFWRARVLDRMELDDQAFSMYADLTAEGKKQLYADDALMDAAMMKKHNGRYAEAAALFEKMPDRFRESKFVSRSRWEAAWCRYLAGEYQTAAEAFNLLAKDPEHRERALYWLARSQERSGGSASESVFKMLLEEYPAGFYAAWTREAKGIKDTRESLPASGVKIDAPLPAGFEKSALLAALGMQSEARQEAAAAAKKKNGGKKDIFPGLARLYLDMSDYGSAIKLFLQNRPVKWDKASLPLWTAGYPMPYEQLVRQHTTENNLSAGLIYALMRAESHFNPVVKSPVGAVGLMQLMPATAKATAKEKGRFDVSRLVVPEYNIKLGTRHFRDLMNSYHGDTIYCVAAYNAGSAAVNRWRRSMKGLQQDEFIENIPYQETREYVKKVYASAAIYRQLYGLK